MGRKNNPIKVGDKFLVKYNNEVEVIQVINCMKILVKSKSGREVWCNHTQLRVGSLVIHALVKKISNTKVEIGAKFQLNCGVTVEVVEYTNCSNLVVQDSEGNRKTTTSSQLRSGSVNWNNRERVRVPIKRILPGSEYWLNCGILVKVLEYIDCDNVVICDSSGNTKRCVGSQLKKGSVSWAEFGVPKPCRSISDVQAGCRWESHNHGWFTILKYNHNTSITIVWDETGEQQHNCTASSIRSGRLVNGSKSWNYLNVDLSQSYVYFAHHNGEVIYIGKGQGQRYLHPNSGRSHSRELNRLYFAGEEVTVSIYKQQISPEDARTLELELIQKYKPKYNIADLPSRE